MNSIHDQNAFSTPPVFVTPPASDVDVMESRQDHEFDAYAAQYEAALNQGLAITGEGPAYYARRRVEWTARIHHSLTGNQSAAAVLDFGCGVGIATPLIRQHLRPKRIVGFDPSSAAIQRANEKYADTTVHFVDRSDLIDRDNFDLAYCNGVFHHISPVHRSTALRSVFQALRPGAFFACWENNPWNPGTRYVMSKIPFDRDAIVISPFQARRMLAGAGFEIVRCDSWFLFPRSLKWFRPLENLVYRLPFGGQYLVVARKPG